MPTLEEMRRWARGEDVKGLPAVKPKPAPEPTKPEKTANEADFPDVVRSKTGNRYSINADKTDALLRFGMFRGHTASELVQISRGRKYLRWIVSTDDFEPELKQVCKQHLDEYRKRMHHGA